MSDVELNPDQLKAFTQNGNPESFVMLNLLKFKPDGGKEHYARYLAESASFAGDLGVTVEYFGLPRELLTGKEDWDVLMLIRYPSRKAFMELINDPGYLKAHEWREKGVDRAVLYATDPVTSKEFIKQTLA